MAEVLERTGNKVKFKVVVPAEEVGQAFAGVYNALARQVRVPGFRPGKAPKSVLEKRVGSDYVLSEVREYLVERAYPQAVKELELIPVSANVTPGDVREGQPFEFTVDAENYPEVTLPEWESFTIEAQAQEVADEDVERAVEDIRQRQATYTPVERASGEGDLVNVEILSGDDKGRNYPVYLERAEPQIRDALTGKSAGDEVEVPLQAGEEGEDGGTLSVRVVDVKEKSIPGLDDEFAKALGVDTLDELRAAIRSDLQARNTQQHLAARKEELVTKLSEGATIDIPAAMIERRRHAMEHDIEHDLERQNMKLADYRKYLEGEGKLEEFNNDLTKSATDRVRRDLVMERLAEQQGTKLTDDEWKNSLESYARANRVSVAKLREAIGEEGIENFRQVVLRDKALEEALSKLTPAATE
ncbi:MAG TPA: trigger factor [Deinococcales bacterium]|nr:trigger factor [Deinococcales bacterium]